MIYDFGLQAPEDQWSINAAPGHQNDLESGDREEEPGTRHTPASTSAASVQSRLAAAAVGASAKARTIGSVLLGRTRNQLPGRTRRETGTVMTC